MVSILGRREEVVKRVRNGLAFGLFVAGSAQAQTSSGMVLYGIIDTTIRYSNNNAGDKNLAELTDGYFNGSRWGMRGTEALGGGLSASVTRAALVRTARKIMDGQLYLPDYVFSRPDSVNQEPSKLPEALPIIVPPRAGGVMLL